VGRGLGAGRGLAVCVDAEVRVGAIVGVGRGVDVGQADAVGAGDADPNGFVAWSDEEVVGEFSPHVADGVAGDEDDGGAVGEHAATTSASAAIVAQRDRRRRETMVWGVLPVPRCVDITSNGAACRPGTGSAIQGRREGRLATIHPTFARLGSGRVPPGYRQMSMAVTDR
jgi:hypothetical protein